MRRSVERLAVTVLSFVLAAPALASGHLSIYNWFDYLPPALIGKFSEKYGVKVSVDTYDSNETMLATITAEPGRYDIAVPSDYMVAQLIRQGRIEKVFPNKMKNFEHVDPAWIDVYWDPGRNYSVPYQWGTTSFMVDTAVYEGNIDTLEILFEPPVQLQGKINMLNDVNEVVNAGLRYLGYERCNTDDEKMRELGRMLVRAKRHWLGFESEQAKELLVSGRAVASQIWNGYAIRARADKKTLKYAFPKEGYTGWMDNLVVIKNAPNMKNARLFLDFMMEPENAALLTNYARYNAGISGVEPFLDESLADAPELNPPDIPEFVPPCPEKVVELYHHIWQNLAE